MTHERQPRQVTVQEVLQRARAPRPNIRVENWGGHTVRISSLEGRSFNQPPRYDVPMTHGSEYQLRPSSGFGT